MGTFATSWAANDTVPAAELNTISGSWTSHTVVVGGSWALGNGTQVGRYKKVGRIVTYNFQVTWGGTSTFGASALTLSVPFTAAGSLAQVGQGIGVDTGTSGYDLGLFLAASGTAVTLYVKSAAGTYVTNGVTGLTTSVPHTWASTDVIYGQIVYESST